MVLGFFFWFFFVFLCYIVVIVNKCLFIWFFFYYIGWCLKSIDEFLVILDVYGVLLGFYLFFFIFVVDFIGCVFVYFVDDDVG